MRAQEFNSELEKEYQCLIFAAQPGQQFTQPRPFGLGRQRTTWDLRPEGPVDRSIHQEIGFRMRRFVSPICLHTMREALKGRPFRSQDGR